MKVVIISHKYRFIFVKTQKTAGTSIETFLSQYCDAGDILTPFGKPVDTHLPRNYEGYFNPIPEIILTRGKGRKKILRQALQREKFHSHIPAWKIRSRIRSKIWNSYFKFCVERNPWDKTLSHYYFVKQKEKYNYILSLDEYLTEGHSCLNYHLYTDYHNSNVVIVDRIVKYESLMQQLGEVFGMLGIPFKNSLNVRAKADYREDRRHYKDVLTEAQRKTIDDIYRKELFLHEYEY